MDLSRALINPLYPDQMGFSMANLVDIKHFEGVFRRVHLKHTFGSSCTFSSSGGGGRNPGPPKGNPKVEKIIFFLKLYLSYSDTVAYTKHKQTNIVCQKKIFFWDIVVISNVNQNIDLPGSLGKIPG